MRLVSRALFYLIAFDRAISWCAILDQKNQLSTNKPIPKATALNICSISNCYLLQRVCFVMAVFPSSLVFRSQVESYSESSAFTLLL